MNNSTTITETLGLPRRPRSPQTPLPTVNPNILNLAPGERAKLRPAPGKTSSFIEMNNRSKNGSSIRSILGKGGADSAPVLPDRSLESPSLVRPISRSARSAVFRASEKGNQDILPTTTSPLKQQRQQPLRARAKSTTSNMTRISPEYSVSSSSSGFFHRNNMRQRGSTDGSSDHLYGNGTSNNDGFGVTSDQLQTSAKSLRSRRKSSTVRMDENASHMSDDKALDAGLHGSLNLFEEEQQLHHHRAPAYSDDYIEDGRPEDDEESQGATKKNLRSFLPYGGGRDFLSRIKNPDHIMWLNMRPQQFITLMLLLAITCFVAGSYWEVLAATEQIETVRIEESRLMVHVHKVQQQALQLAENMKRINDRNDGTFAGVSGDEGEGDSSSGDPAREIDADLIRVQIDKLRDMEAELDHEVSALRKTIQQAAKQELIKHFGEGGIQVFLEMESFGGDGNSATPSFLIPGKNTVSMRLWYDTPHTGWTFLQQVERGAWNGAVMHLDRGRVLSVDPNVPNGVLQPNLDFLEPSERGHDRYTVTLTDQNLLINLQDNKKMHQTQEACVGVIFEGFDVLHNVVRDASASKTIRIKQIKASHMTRAESASLF